MDSVVILANGIFPKHTIPLRILDKATSVICCDGAVNSLEKYGTTPTQIIGDFDSILPEIKIKYKNQLIHIADQNENDLRKALTWVEKNGVEEVSILGATGNRDDHSLANIFTILEFPIKLKLFLYTDFGKFSILKEKRIFDSFIGEQVSLFATDPTIEISTNNLKYYLNNKRLTNLYCGSLNESLNACFTISISHGKILVFQAYHTNV